MKMSKRFIVFAIILTLQCLLVLGFELRSIRTSLSRHTVIYGSSQTQNDLPTPLSSEPGKLEDEQLVESTAKDYFVSNALFVRKSMIFSCCTDIDQYKY